MTTFRAPYALATLKNFTFKEISFSEYAKYSSAISELQQIQQQKYSDEINISAEITKLRNDLQKKYALLTTQYIEARRKLDEFVRRYRSILDKGEWLEKAESYEKLSWIFSLSTQEKDLARHHEKYKHIYEQLRILSSAVFKLEPYSKERIDKTISTEVSKTHYSLMRCNESNLERWNKQYNEKIRVPLRILEPISKYELLMCNLIIDCQGAICTISGTGMSIFNGCQQTVHQTLINKTVQIIR